MKKDLVYRIYEIKIHMLWWVQEGNAPVRPMWVMSGRWLSGASSRWVLSRWLLSCYHSYEVRLCSASRDKCFAISLEDEIYYRTTCHHFVEIRYIVINCQSGVNWPDHIKNISVHLLVLTVLLQVYVRFIGTMNCCSYIFQLDDKWAHDNVIPLHLLHGVCCWFTFNSVGYL